MDQDSRAGDDAGKARGNRGGNCRNLPSYRPAARSWNRGGSGANLAGGLRADAAIPRGTRDPRPPVKAISPGTSLQHPVVRPGVPRALFPALPFPAVFLRAGSPEARGGVVRSDGGAVGIVALGAADGWRQFSG